MNWLIHPGKDRAKGNRHFTRGLLLVALLSALALLLLASAAQAGTVWAPNGVPISTAAYSQYNPEAIPDGAGGAIITWQDSRTYNQSQVYAQRVDSSGRTLWTPNGVAIRSLAGSSGYNARLCPDGSGGAIIAWYDYRSNVRIYAQRVNAQGVVQWTANGVLVNTVGTQEYNPSLVSDGAGGAVVTYREYGSPSGIYAQRLDPTGSSLWGTGTALCTLGSSQSNEPEIASDGAGGAVVTWIDQRNGSGADNLFAQRVYDNGAVAWAANGIAIDTAGDVNQQQIASDSAGGAVFAWASSRGGGLVNTFAQRVNQAGATLWNANGVRACPVNSNQTYPQLATDGSSNTVLTWEDSRGGSVDIYAQKLLASGAVAPGWNPAGLVIANSGDGQYNPVITSDGSGGAIIAWQTGSVFFDGGGNNGGSDIALPRVYAQQALSSGKVSPAWKAGGEPITQADLIQYDQTIVTDGAGGAIVPFVDYRTGSDDIYAQRVRTSASTWYLAEGTSAWGFKTYITIENPNPSEVTAAITYMTPKGPLPAKNVKLAASSQTTVDPLADIGYETDFSTRVVASNGMPIGVDRTMRWTGPGAPSEEAHASVGVNSPNNAWFLPEGCSAFGFESWLLIQNPNANEATCTVTYMIEGATPKQVTEKIPANSRQSFNMTDAIGQQNASIQVASDIPVIAERSMYRNNRREGSNSIGAIQTSNDYYLAEGTTDHGFTTYVLVQNPNSNPCMVSLIYMTPSGPQPQAPFSMAAYSRKTVKVNDSLAATDFSTQLHSDLPVVAERALYWGAGTPLGEAMHDTIGTDSAHATWYLPDGQSSDGHETYALVQNPNDVPVAVEVSYLTPGGTQNVTFTDTIPAQSRKTYTLADRIPSVRAATLVTSKTAGRKIICERAMYWNSRGAGTCTIGGSSN
jgi:hypothetical protein